MIEAGELERRLGEVVVVDCRWKLGEPGAGRAAWLAGHIPGAAHLDVDSDLSAPPGPRGRHPLPSAEDFQAAARRAGIRDGVPVVAYDAAGEGGAARLWWLLRHFGHGRPLVLDGAFAAWEGPLRDGEERPQPGDFSVRPRHDDTLEPDQLEGHALLDARVPERYHGETEPIDPLAGHIPGALNVPFKEIAPDGRFLAPERLRERLEGHDDAVAYCGSGVTAAVLVLAAEAAGLPAPRLYPGSWSEWSARGLPVETALGHEPQ